MRVRTAVLPIRTELTDPPETKSGWCICILIFILIILLILVILT